MDYNKEITGNIIRTERNKLGITQAELGNMVKTSGKQISNYEKGITAPPMDMMFSLCKVFNCELGYLLGEEDYTEKSKLSTMIVNETGLSLDAIKVLKEVKRFSKDYSRVANALISSTWFFSFISDLEALDSAIEKYEAPIRKLYKTFDKELIDEAVEIETSGIDYNYDPNAPQLRPELLEVVRAVEDASDDRYSYSYNVKIARYELHRCYEALIESIFPALSDDKNL